MFLSVQEILGIAIGCFAGGQVVGLFYAWAFERQAERAPGIHRRVGYQPELPGGRPPPTANPPPKYPNGYPAFLRRQAD